jgi:hypothetical protein
MQNDRDFMAVIPAQEWPNEPRDIGFIALLVFVCPWLWWSVAPLVACAVLTSRQSACSSAFCNVCNISEMRLGHILSSVDGRLIDNPAGRTGPDRAGPGRTLWEPNCTRNGAIALHGPRCLLHLERETCCVHCLWKVLPRLLPLVLLLRATCRWRWAWSIGGMILTGETEVLGKSPVQYYTIRHKSHITPTSYRSRTSAVSGRRRWVIHGTAWDFTYI